MPEFDQTLKQEIQQSLADKDVVKQRLNEFEHNYLLREKFKSANNQTNLNSSKARHLRWKLFENLEDNLTQLDAKLSQSGIKVKWAEDSKQVIENVNSILKKNHITYFTAENHPTREELNLDQNLQNLGYKGIVQERWEKLYQEKVDNRPAIHQSAIISSVRFLVIDEGLIALSPDAPMQKLNITDAPVRIYIAGIDQIIQSVQHIQQWMKLVYNYKYFKHFTPDFNLFGGFGKENIKGEDYLIIFDQGRSDVLGSQEHREGLYCINCEACAKSAESYLLNNGQSNRLISSPIRHMIAPVKNSNPKFYQLAFSSTLSDAPTQICPVGIKLNKRLRYNRQMSVEKTAGPLNNKWALSVWKKTMLNPKLLNSGKAVRNISMQLFLHKVMGKPYLHFEPAAKPFRKLYQEMNF